MLHDQQKSFPYIFTLIFCSLLFPSCLSKIGSSSLIGSSIDSEAQSEAERFWATQVTKCGDSYYRKLEIRGGVATEFMEFKEPVVRIAAYKVSEADHLNGIDWHGTTLLRPKVTRVWGSDLKRWGKWNDGTGEASNLSYSMKKVNRRWSIPTNLGGIFDEVEKYFPADCSQLPQ